MATRILFALPGLHGGGAERVVVTVLRHLDRARFEPHLLVAAAVGPYLGEVPADVPVHAVGATRLRRALPGLVRAVWRLRPAAIASTQGYMNFALLLARPLLPRTRLVVREVIGERYLENSRHRDLLYRWYLRRVRVADRIVTQSDGAAREIAARVDARPGQVARIYNPVDVTRVVNEARVGERPYAGAGPHVVAAGRIGPMRSYFDLFFMGAAFLLLETKSVVQFALLFGTTWIVNALVFVGVLLAVLLAIETASRMRVRRLSLLYALLFAALAVAWAVPPGNLLGLGIPTRLAAAFALFCSTKS